MRRVVPVLISGFMALILMGCASKSITAMLETPGTPGSKAPAAAPAIVLVPVIIESPNPAYANAQATIDTGKSQLVDLSRKETDTALNMSQAANAAALSTQDYNQRQKMELNFQATVVSLNITQAAATQKFIAQQTKLARDTTSAAQSSAATAAQAIYLMEVNQTAQAQSILDGQANQTAQAAAALTAFPLTETYSAYLLNATQTAQVQEILNAQATQTAQAGAALTAYPLTATPFALTQAALLLQQYGREQQSFVNQIVTPLLPILAALVLVLFILVIIFAYRRFMARSWPSRLRMVPGILNPNPLIIDGVIVDRAPPLPPMIPEVLLPANPPTNAADDTKRVEVVNPTEPPFAHWIAEVEHKLAGEGGLSL